MGSRMDDNMTKRKASAKGGAGWRNRIVGHAKVDPAKLLENPFNWKIHDAMQTEALAGTIRELGYLRSVTVNRKSGRIIDGHLRVSLAIREKQKTIAVEYVELNAAEERAAIASMDPLTLIAGNDQEKIGELLKQLDDGSQVRAILAGLAREEPGSGDDHAKGPTAADTLFKIGVYKFTVPTAAYMDWVEKIRQKSGFDEESIITELKRRLRL